MAQYYQSLRAIVADADATTRSALTQILVDTFHVEVVELCNGLEVLRSLQTTLPDFVLMALDIDKMDGMEVLGAIRSDTIFRNLPVVVFTEQRDKDVFRQLLSLGITDYILKPIDKAFVIDRFYSVLPGIREKLSYNAAGELRPVREEYRSLLIADGNLRYTEYFEYMLRKRFRVLKATNGAAALEMWQEHRPRYIFIGQKLPLLGENSLARKIRLENPSEALIYLLSDGNLEAKVSSAEFNGVIRKTTDAEYFSRQLRQIAFARNDITMRISDIIREFLPPELEAAAAKTFRTLVGCEIQLAEFGSIQNDNWELSAYVPLCSKGELKCIIASIAVSFETAGWIARKVLRTTVTEDEEVTGVLVELINTIAGGLLAAFRSLGVVLEERQGKHQILKPNEALIDVDLSLVFQCSEAKPFMLTLKVVDLAH